MDTWPALRLRFTPSIATQGPTIQDLVAAALDGLRPTAIHEQDAEWLVFFGSPADRDRAAEALPAAAPDGVTVARVDVPDEDWARRSQDDLGAVHVGRITIAPPWLSEAAGAERAGTGLTILIQPSMGFGTGHHATTRLCTALLQRIDLGDKTVLDVGTGSGVLALVARALGARRVIAIDDDAHAIESARENLQLNGASSGIDLQVGDFRQLSLLPADVVTANLTGGFLIGTADRLAEAVAPSGSLIVSGLMQEEAPDVLAALASSLVLVDRLDEDEWVGARLVRTEARRPA
jgi:ribosomal protein L11 methyltransferase